MSVELVVVAIDVPRQVVFSGVMNGMTYGVAAVGIVLVYRSTRVINVAVAAMGGLAAALLARMVINEQFNYWIAFSICVVVGGLTGWVIDRLVIRRLFDSPRVVLLVATIGVAQLLLFAQAILPQPSHVTSFPTGLRHSWIVGGVAVRGEHALILVIIPFLTTALALFLNRTKAGIAVRAAAANPDAARLAGVNVKRMSTIVWVLAGGLAAIATILSAPITTTTAGDVFLLGPGLLVRVLAAALIGRMVSPTGALLGGVAVGTGEALLFYNLPNAHGVLDVALLVVVLVAMLPLARRGAAAESLGGWSFGASARPVPRALQGLWWVRRLPHLVAIGAIAAALAPFLVVHGASQQELWSRVVIYALIALSLTVLAGWAGQLSLGQFAFVGLGAMTTAALVHSGLGFAPALGVAAVVGALAAIVVGAPALRIPGQLLAISSLGFAVAASSWLLSRSMFIGSNPSVSMPRAVVGSISLAPQRTYYVVCLFALVLILVVVARVRHSGFGRAMIAVRGNERAAAAAGLSPARVKLTAFAISGAIAGFGGGLLAGLYVTFGPERFTATESFQVISIAVIGGLASIPGTVLGALWVVGVPVLFSNDPNVALLTSGAGLLALLLFFPGGLVQLVYRIRDVLFARAARDRPEPPPPTRLDVGTTVSLGSPVRRSTTEIAISVRDLTVRFGTRVVVDGVSLDVRRGEVVGLIGTNGAGKSTIMNAIGGFVRSSGVIELLGRDVRGHAPARRARAGLGRTFQGAELFTDLTVSETIAVALEAREPTALSSTLLALPRARRSERAKRAHADKIIGLFGLGDFADRFVSELSTGTRRIVELGCVVASGAQVLCLDEPTAGLAQRESEAFGPLLLEIRRELDASVLVIEHDMPVVLGMCDRVYCIEAGRVISEGTPDEVRSDPLVLASYIGMDSHGTELSESTVQPDHSDHPIR